MGIFGFKPRIEEMEKRQDIEGLMKALRHENYFVQQRAADALSRIGEPAVEPLIHALKDENLFVRSLAAEALGNIGHVKAVEPLTQALMDEDIRVRSSTVKALSRLGDVSAMQALAQTLRDEIGSIRWQAAEALDELGWRPANNVEKAHYLIAKMAWGELVILGEPAVEPLLQALKYKDVPDRGAVEEALEKRESNTQAKIAMTKRLIHVIIYTEEPLKADNATIAGYVAAAFPEEVEGFDPSTVVSTLREKTLECSIMNKIRFNDKHSENSFKSWMKSLRKGVHDLPRDCEKLQLIGSTGWGAMFFPSLLEHVNPQYATSAEYIRKWSVIDGKLLVIGVYSMVSQ